MKVERCLNSERVDRELTKKDEKCKELDCVEADTNVTDNFKETKESLSTFVCCNGQRDR